MGIAARTIILAAAERGLGGCMLGSIHREQLSTVLVLPEKYEIQLVPAIGYPAESIVLEPLEQNGDTRYWWDEQGIHPQTVLKRYCAYDIRMKETGRQRLSSAGSQWGIRSTEVTDPDLPGIFSEKL